MNKKKLVIFIIFFSSLLLSFIFNRITNDRFIKTYSQVKTEEKPQEVTAHGRIYYVSSKSVKENQTISWITIAVGILSAIILVSYYLKKKP